MPATLTVYQPTRAGLSFLTRAVAATGAGDTWTTAGAETLWVQNGSGSAITVTLTWGTNAGIDSPLQVPTARTVSVAAGDIVAIGVFSALYKNTVTGFAGVTYSSVTTVKVLVVNASQP